MNLALAILNLLDTLPRPVTAGVVVAQLPAFYNAPVTIAQVEAELATLKETGDVHTQPRKHLGMLYSITPSGKAAIA